MSRIIKLKMIRAILRGESVVYRLRIDQDGVTILSDPGIVVGCEVRGVAVASQGGEIVYGGRPRTKDLTSGAEQEAEIND